MIDFGITFPNAEKREPSTFDLRLVELTLCACNASELESAVIC